MTWDSVTLDHVRAVIRESRLDKAVDPQFDGQLESRFGMYHRSIIAEIRARISESHDVDANPLLVPPEFVMLAALRIAQILLGRPGQVQVDGQDAYALHPGQKAELDRLEKRLDAVADGGKCTATDNPSTSNEASSGAPSPVVIAPTLNWGRDSQAGIGAY
jgi:hypothetical protein